MTTNNTQTLVSDDSYLMWNGTALTAYESYVEKRKLNTGQVEGSTLINSLYPVFDMVPVDSQINIYVKSQNNYIDNPDYTSEDLFIFEPNNKRSQGYKIDPRVNGRIMNFKISSMGSWRLPLYAFDAKAADRR
jgi:hypothetical protein